MSKEEKKTQAVAKVAPVGAVSTAVDYGADAGAGFENQTRDDISIPFLAVLQPLSPVITSNEKARAGNLFNTITEELFDGNKGVVVVPATTKHVFVEWKPRERGGGFIGVHQVESDVVKKALALAGSKGFGRYKTPEGNDLIETFYIYGVTLDDAENPADMVTIAFTSTKISPYKRWNTKVNMFTLPTPGGGKVRPPLFAHKVRITSVREENDKGQYFNFNLQPANGAVAESLLPPGHPALEQAKEIRKMIDAGAATAAYATQEGAAAAPGANTGDPDWNA